METTLQRIKRTALKYSTHAQAMKVVERVTKPMMAVLGDDEKVWVVTPADGQWLESMGYEVVG